jgi:hypothetical protein
MTIIMITPLSFVKAEVDTEAKSKYEYYATPNDMILDLVQHKVDKTIQKEYGKSMQWGWVKLKDVKYVLNDEKNNPRTWYQVKAVIMVEDFNKKESKIKLDSLTFKFTPNTKLNTDFSTSNVGGNFELLEYKKNDGNAH